MQSELHKLQAKYENYTLLTTSRTTATRYARALEAFLSKFQDKRTPDEFTRMDVQDYVLYRRREGVSARSINYEVNIVRAFFNWLMKQDLMSYNPAGSVKRLPEMEPERDSLTEEEQNKLYETATATGNPLNYLLVGLVLSTGLRAKTLVELSKADVDFERQTIRVPAAKMKTRRSHEVPLRDDLAAIIETLPEGRLFEGFGENASQLSYRFSKLLRRSGSKLRGLRLGRRTFATTLLRTGANLRIVQDLLGHRNIATTSRYLVTADMPETRSAVDKLPRPNPSSVDMPTML